MVKAQMAISTLVAAIAKFIWTDDFLFPASMWLVSRIFIGTAMLLIAPNLPALQDGITPHFGWGIFDAWDSVHYRAISTEGYEFIDDGKQHNLAFFPLFPVSIFIFMKFGFPFELAGFDIYNFNPSTPLENVPVKLELPSELEFNGDVAEKVVNVPAGGEVYVSWHLKTKSQTANPSVTGRIFNSSVSGQYANRSILIKNYTDSLVADVSVAHGLLAVYIVNQGQTFTINSYVYNWTDGPLSGIILEAIEENGLEITSGQNPVTLSMIDPQNQSTPDTTWQVRYTTAGSKTLKVRAYYQDQGYVEGTMLVTVNPVVAADKETNEISTKNSNKKNSIFGHLMK